MTTNATVGIAPTGNPVAEGSRRLTILALVIASAAAVIAVFAIATDDVSTEATTAVQHNSATQAWTGGPTVDACGRPVVSGRLACR